jgi:thymidylate synthase (FAD)
MNVKLISYTVPNLELFEAGIEDMQELVAYCARVSNPSNQLNTETSENLINYLIEHKHWSPLEMVNVCVEIKTTRDIGRQILRHRSFTFQEFSQRYADPTESLGFTHRECRMQDPKNRQSSDWCTDEELKHWWESVQTDIMHDAQDVYEQAIRRGVAKEIARAVLPEGLMQTRLYMNGTLRSFIHYCQLRTGVETQKEHREIAEACVVAIAGEFPAIKGICDANK